MRTEPDAEEYQPERQKDHVYDDLCPHNEVLQLCVMDARDPSKQAIASANDRGGRFIQKASTWVGGR